MARGHIPCEAPRPHLPATSEPCQRLHADAPSWRVAGATSAADAEMPDGTTAYGRLARQLSGKLVTRERKLLLFSAMASSIVAHPKEMRTYFARKVEDTASADEQKARGGRRGAQRKAALAQHRGPGAGRRLGAADDIDFWHEPLGSGRTDVWQPATSAALAPTSLSHSPYVLHTIDNPDHSLCTSMRNYALRTPPWRQILAKFRVNQSMRLRLLDDPNLVHLFSENWGDPDYAGHPKLTRVPIGFDSGQAHLSAADGGEGALLHAARVLPPTTKRPLCILSTAHIKQYPLPASHSPLGNSRERMQAAIEPLRRRSRPHNQSEPDVCRRHDSTGLLRFHNKRIADRRDLYAEYRRVSFELCPEGNGLDTHRFYEAYLCGVIPIVVRGALSDFYEANFPGTLVLDRWEDLRNATTADLARWRAQLAPQLRRGRAALFMGHWRERVERVYRDRGLRFAY